ncbi:carbohydrate ABC transporter permease [Georgenia halophila]|uniref:Carbohydrate ABC transporter permease n=1 Tax=Georgenia halophila TaxID=620889 RepID=A0ABP8LCY4_9MICO
MTAAVRRSAIISALVAVLVGLILVPFLWVLTNAFKNDSEIFGETLSLPASWTLQNFETAWTQGKFAAYFANSVVVAISATVITVVVATPAGYVFGRLAGRGTGWLFYVLLVTITLPVEAIVVPVFYQMRAIGLIDSLTGLTLVIVATGLPLGVFIMRNFFRDLPDSLSEAAAIDGASTWRTFFLVMAPLAKPAMLAVTVFAFLGAWNEYLLALLLLFSNDTMTIPLGLTQFQGQYSSDYGALFGGITLAMIPSIVVYLALQRAFTEGLLAGSSK